jgi:hypothetical protein
MSNDQANPSGNSELAAMSSKQTIERNVKDVPAPAAAPALPPWTAEFDLPSVRAPEPKRD